MPAIEPNPAGFQISVVKDTTTPPGIPASILPLTIIGYCSKQDTLKPNDPTPFSTPGAVLAAGASGPGVEHAAAALDSNGGVRLVHLVNVEVTGDGTYGDITATMASANAPVVEADESEPPEDDFDQWIVFTAGGTLGTAGIKYRTACDNDLHYFAELKLGTATSITLPNGGGKINLSAPLATLLARANDIAAKLNAHAVLTSGGVHGAADPNAPYTFTSAVDATTLYTLCGELKVAGAAHVVITASSVHGAADTSAAAAIAALVAPTTNASAQTFLAGFATAFFGDGATANSGHTLRTTSSIHGAADNTNVLAAIGSLGVITANDTIVFSTLAPAPDATQIQAAMQSLRQYAGQDGTLTFSAPITGAMLSTINAELVELWKRGKFYNVVAPLRRPTLTETAAQYDAAIETSMQDVVEAPDVRMISGAVYHESAIINTADGRATPRRPNAWWVSMAAARREPEDYLAFITPQNGVRIVDGKGKALPGCLDESTGELYSVLNRTCGTRTDYVRDRNLGVFLTQDLVVYNQNSDWILGPHSAVLNHAFRIAAPVIIKASSNPKGFPSPPTGPLDDEVVRSLESSAQGFLYSVIIDKKRETNSRTRISESTAAVLKWRIENVPNYYPINGVEITGAIVSKTVEV